MYPSACGAGRKNMDKFVTTPVAKLGGAGEHPTRTLKAHQKTTRHKNSTKEYRGTEIIWLKMFPFFAHVWTLINSLQTLMNFVLLLTDSFLIFLRPNFFIRNSAPLLICVLLQKPLIILQFVISKWMQSNTSHSYDPFLSQESCRYLLKILQSCGIPVCRNDSFWMHISHTFYLDISIKKFLSTATISRYKFLW